MQKKKLAIFINTLKRAGAEKIVAFLLNQLHSEFELHLLMFNTTEIEFSIPSSIIIRQIGKPKIADPRPIDILKMPFQAAIVKKYLRDNNIPVLLSFLNRPNFISGIVKMLGWKGKSIISERTMTSTYYTNKTWGGKVGRLLVNRLYKKADLIITNSRLCEEDLKETFQLKNDIITIYNPVNLKEAARENAPVTEEMGRRNGEFVFCSIGRYSYHKNQELLLQAFSKLANAHCRLVFIGKEIPVRLSPQLTQLNLQEQVTLIGLQHNIFPYLHAADAFILSSRLEGFPNVIIEALACSLPVIATDCKSGPREILAPGTSYPGHMAQMETGEYGILVENENVAMLAAAMKRIIDDKELYQIYKNKAFNRVKEYDMNVIIKSFETTIGGFYW